MFVGKNAIGIGCLIKGQISYFNFSDESLKKDEAYTYDFSKADTDRIMNATKDNPIRLRMNKKKLSEGFGSGGLCYSHMTNIEIVN